MVKHPFIFDFILVGLLIWLLTLRWTNLPQAYHQTRYSKVVLSENNEILSARVSADEQWSFPPTELVAPHYWDALLTYEDQYFYLHPGINPWAIAKAFFENFTRKKREAGAPLVCNWPEF